MGNNDEGTITHYENSVETMSKSLGATGNNVNVTIPFRMTHKNVELLSRIKTSLDGIIYQATDETGTVNRYSTVSFYRAKSVAFYFGKYHLINNSNWLRYIY